jgi:hypothetical protein|tara:strand:- start:492 stop:905 length:414 start_codon:yes stop_codon:yes gene_type:complete
MGLFYVHIPKSSGMKKKKLPKALGTKKMSKSPKMKKLLEARAKHRKFLISYGVNPDKNISPKNFSVVRDRQNTPIRKSLVVDRTIKSLDTSKLQSSGGTKPLSNWRLEESKNFTVAPAYNKGAYQVISRKDVKDIGR